MASTLILDYYIDEPACFGVPPYISPYIRYLAGSLVKSGVKESQIVYKTIDELRTNKYSLLAENKDYESVYLMAGSTVPGKYLGGKIGTLADILHFLAVQKEEGSLISNRKIFIGGPIKYGSEDLQNKIRKAGGTLVAIDLDDFVALGHSNRLETDKHSSPKYKTDFEEISKRAIMGSFITRRHPNFPYLICEMETYRGCSRSSHCSFCTEAFYGAPSFRESTAIIEEVKSLYDLGNRYFRLGRQSDIFTYGANLQDRKKSYPRPNPAALENLYQGIRNVAPDLKMLHLDNVNPAGLIHFPDESLEISKIISNYNTTGDTAAMGFESVDPIVIKANNLKLNASQGLQALKIISKYGTKRENGIPKLLPGINFIQGLPGENKNTYKQNFAFLEEAKNSGLLIRRINLRKLVPFPGTSAYNNQNKNNKNLLSTYEYYKSKIREEIDLPMLKAIFPLGLVLNEVIIEQQYSGQSLGRPLGSYPITIKLPLALEVRTVLANVIIINHRERSLLALPYPIAWEELHSLALSHIPGISKKRASEIIFRKKEIQVRKQIQDLLDPIFL